ncbi:MAG: HAD family phosphatase [Clostridia bacterium]|nr:HAD family phosphatase [Clostridia bacterium]
MIRNIVFDMGNVLRDFNPVLCVGAYVEDSQDARLLRETIFGSPEWKMLDRGSITYEEAQSRWASRLPARLHGVMAEIVAHWHEHMPEIPGMVDLTRELKGKGYRLYLLSNASVRYDVFKSLLDSLQYMEGAVVSAYYGYLKPEKELYQILFDTYGLKPEESFFVDDQPLNIQAAQALGMAGHVFDQNNIDALRKALREVGVQL